MRQSGRRHTRKTPPNANRPPTRADGQSRKIEASGNTSDLRVSAGSVASRRCWMPRPGQVKPETDERLSDRIAVGLLTRTFPPDLVDRVVAESGRSGQRTRLLPPRVVVYFVLAM